MVGRREETALGVARARFVDGLPRKAKELDGAVDTLGDAAGQEKPREELRRRLHALYASAQVFRIEGLSEALKGAIDTLDAARDEKRPVEDDELEALRSLAANLSGLANGDAGQEPQPSLKKKSEPPPRRATQPGFTVQSPDGFRPSAPTPEPPAAADDVVDLDVDDVALEVEEPPKPAFSPKEATLTGAPPIRPGETADEAAARIAAEAGPVPSQVPGPVPSQVPGPVPSQVPGPGPSQVPGPGPSQVPGPAPASASAPAPRRSSRPAAPGQPLETVVSVLLIDGSEAEATVRATLASDHFELLVATDAEEALRLARSGSPDVVLAASSIALADGAELIARLRSDPLTDFVPVILLASPGESIGAMTARDAGADDVLEKPVKATPLLSAIARLTGLGGAAAAFDALGDMTVDQVADRIAAEVRRGLVESLERGESVNVPMGQGSEVLAAAWAAIARARSIIAERSGGEVRFRDTARRGGPALMALAADEEVASTADGTEVSLSGRRVIIADDDPAVVWFFAGLLREAGADVVEADDGVEALRIAREQRPDVILSDILMPNMDGLALCRELERDPALAEVPVILLSWKEDFLQRMRELKSGASGYLRKEAGSAQILERVRDVLRPRARLEAQLRAGGEVRGRIEGIGVVPLLRTAGSERPDARVAIRDAWNLFEVELHAGRITSITRTATDGSFSRGEAALPQLVGVSAGRFTVSDAEGSLRASAIPFEDDALEVACRGLGSIIEAVSGTSLAHDAVVRFEEDVLAAFLESATGAPRELIERLQAGEGPRDLLLAGDVAPQLLETTLIDLARRGAIVSVIGEDGKERAALPVPGRPRVAPVDSQREPGEITQEVSVDEMEVVPADEPVEIVDAEIEAVEEEPPRVIGVPSMVPESEPPPMRREPAAPIETSEPARPLTAAGSEPPPALVPAARPSKGMGAKGWFALLLALVAVGFVVVRLVASPPAAGPGVAVEPGDGPSAGTESAAGDPTPAQPGEPGVPTPPEPVQPGLSFGRSISGVADAGVEVNVGEAALVVQVGPAGPGTRVFLDDRELGEAPTRLAVRGGRHELVFRRGDVVSYRFINLRPGETRVVQAP